MSIKENEHTLKISQEEQKELINKLIQKFKEEWMSATVQEHIYALEYADPKHITKAKAEEGLATYQQRIKYIEQNITALHHYAKYNKIEL